MTAPFISMFITFRFTGAVIVKVIDNSQFMQDYIDVRFSAVIFFKSGVNIGTDRFVKCVIVSFLVIIKKKINESVELYELRSK